MKTLDEISDILTDRISTACEQLDSAQLEFICAKDSGIAFESFKKTTSIVGHIEIINSEGIGNSCSVMKVLAKLADIDAALILIELENEDDYCNVSFSGIIIDDEGRVLFACQFSQGFDEKLELFDRLLAEYAQWKFDI